MGSMNLRQKFDPLDTEKDAEEEDALRKRVFALADPSPLDFDTLSITCWRVWTSIGLFRAPLSRGSLHELQVFNSRGLTV